MAVLLSMLAVVPALAANLAWEDFEEDPFPVWPPEDLEIPDVRSIVPMLVVPSGENLWRASGRLTPDAEAELRAVVAK